MTLTAPQHTATRAQAGSPCDGLSPRTPIDRYLFSSDHKTVSLQYLLFTLAMLAFGGLLALLMRWQLAYPNDPTHPVPVIGRLLGWSGGVMPPDTYTAILSVHATVMIFLVAIPLLVGGFGGYLIPLKIGARSMALPRVHAIGFWMLPPAAVLLVAALGLPYVGAGWTSYPPLASTVPPGASSAWPQGWAMALTVACAITVSAVLWLATTHWSTTTRAIATVALAPAIGWAMSRGAQLVAIDGQAAWFLALIWTGLSNLLTSANYIATIVTMRAPGMHFFRLPLSVWNLLITAVMVLLATPVLAAALLLNLLDHLGHSSFFLPANWQLSGVVQANAGGGQPLLHQHLFWFYSHPAVYIMILPVMGTVSDILATFSRKPLFGYFAMVLSSVAIALLGFLVWAHHMFQSGMSPAFGTAFSLATFLIAVPSGVKVLNWIGTMWRGRLVLNSAMWCCVSFVALFVIGGLSGVVLASTAVNVQFHDTYFVVAHIHYVLFGGTLFGIFATIYYYYPKLTGRLLSEKLGLAHVALTFLAFNLTFGPMHLLGTGGVPRRYADGGQGAFPQYATLNKAITHSAFLLGAAQLPFIANVLLMWRFGRRAGDNPWQAATLEWQTSSPPPPDNFRGPRPVVHRGPYDYSLPEREADFVPQTVP
jgi:cytochrome c oxidase subunit 1